MVTEIVLEPIARVRSPRIEPVDDFWGDVEATIELDPRFPEECLDGIDTFSHLEIIYQFHRVPAGDVVLGARRPRNNSAWPAMGIFAQRAKARPNRLGSCIARLVRRDGRRLVVTGLDAIDGSPVLDIKPVMTAVLPRETVREPSWVGALMKNYWRGSDA